MMCTEVNKMRILTKIQCGLVIIADIAINSDDGSAVNLYEIAERRAISVKYLEQLVTRLRQSSLIKSIKGPHGGYILSRIPEKCSGRKSRKISPSSLRRSPFSISSTRSRKSFSPPSRLCTISSCREHARCCI